MKAGLEIWKFGGASLADEHGIARAAAQVQAHRGPMVVVASALAGVTDLLLGAAQHAANGDTAPSARAAETFRSRHIAAAKAIATGKERDALIAAIEAATREYADLCNALGLLGHLEPRAQDLLVSRGERMSTSLLAVAIAAHRKAEYVDALDVIASDAAYGNAAPELAATARAARARLLPLVRRGAIPVVPGFIGRAPDGSLTTLGRGGTDLTATLLGAIAGRKGGRVLEGRARHHDGGPTTGTRCPRDPPAASP